MDNALREAESRQKDVLHSGMEKPGGSQSLKMLAVPPCFELLPVKSICDSECSVNYFSPEQTALP